MISRRGFLGAAAGAAASLPCSGAQAPNIVYILADDLGWGDLGCYNRDSQVPTPHSNRLAREGVRFTDMHSPSSVCTPTRYGILTGRYCWRTHLKSGVLNGYSPNLIEPGRMTVASLLKSRGYSTGCIGKWHLGLGDKQPADFDQPLKPNPGDHGFEYFYGIPASLDMAPYVYVENDRVVEKATSHTPGRNEPRGVFWREGPIAPGFEMEEVLPVLTRKAVEFIRQRAAKPFFLYLPLAAPHTPWVPTKPWLGRSKAGLYGDFVAQVDDAVGQVMRVLEETKTASNTLLIFTSDNGAHWTPDDKAKFPHRANAHWRGMKADIWDAGHRIPFLARWPGRAKAGLLSEQLGCLTDLLGTVAEIHGAKLPDNAGEDSFSWLSALEGKRCAREAVVHHSSQGMFSIRRGEWKLALGLGSGGFSEPRKLEPKPGEAEGQLYDIARDPSEENNLYQKRPEIVAELKGLLEKYQREGRSRFA